MLMASQRRLWWTLSWGNELDITPDGSSETLYLYRTKEDAKAASDDFGDDCKPTPTRIRIELAPIVRKKK